ncbi:MAG TPA: cupin domain-containing protein [Candidatus Binatia bacterium]|nr:cupin domain-containing protein [Candidatus Binatia bacterium]
MSILFRKIQWIVAGAALVLVGALAAGTWFRADSAQLGDQQKLVRTEKLPNVPGKSITAIVVSYPPGGKSGPHHHAGSVFAYVLSGAIRSENSATGPVKVYKPVKASLSRPEAAISSVRMRAQKSPRACSLCGSPMTARS